MAIKKKGLGRGLDALLADVGSVIGNAEEGSLQKIALQKIQPGKYQPRVVMSEQALAELADSIRVQGLVQPIVIRPISDDRYEIIAGERRWRASKLAGLDEIPALVRDISDRSAIAMALIENIQRENLNPMEEANALFRLREEFELTHQQAAEMVGKSRTAVTNLLRLRNLNDDVKRMLEEGELEMGHARALLSLDAEKQSAAARQVAEKGLSVRETEQLIRRLLEPAVAQKNEQIVPQAELTALEKQLHNKLGKGFSIKHRASGKGKLVFDYNDIDELKRLIKQIVV